MKFPTKKSKFQRALDAVTDSLDGVNSIERGLTGMTSRKELKAINPQTARTAAVIAGTAAGLTAGSAGISSYRRRREEASDDS